MTPPQEASPTTPIPFHDSHFTGSFFFIVTYLSLPLECKLRERGDFVYLGHFDYMKCLEYKVSNIELRFNK